jgi:uncharacterized PurR-regulated membrane protein YhhQ (DUF165 family)|tara:strand:- start:143937 stop:144701 length:765 start_codon:yes stop_codon:yes gene_type:complete
MTEVAPISEELRERRELVFLILAGFFICSMTLLNVIGITRFVQLGPMQLAIGVLPYPLTFLCTDLVCELYGKRRANRMVSVGLLLNFFILAVLYIGQLIPAVGLESRPPWQDIYLAADVGLPDGTTASGSVELFALIYATTSGAVFASMLAYVAAQYIDVRLFHFWKRITKGKHLWVRNNFSTIMSQLVDSFAVIAVTFGAAFLRGDMALGLLMLLMFNNYLFKFFAAVIDTPLIYLCVWKLKPYLGIEEEEYE